MNGRVFRSAVFFILLCGWSPLTAAAQSKSVAEVWAREADYWRLAKAGDVEGYRALWHEKFVGWPCEQPHPMRKVRITDWIQKIRDEKIKMDAELVQEGAEDFGSVVVAHYSVTITNTYPDGGLGKPGIGPSEHSKITHTWMKVAGTWLIIGGMCGPLPASTARNTPGSASGPVSDRLIGTWRLISDFEIRPDGSRHAEWGSHPAGYLMYDKTGHMCVTLGNADMAKWTDAAKPTDAERAETHKSMEAYCGAYELREKDAVVVHRPELAEWPHYIGSEQVRHYRFDGDDRLVLSLEEIVPGGEKYRYEITWGRVK
jgi:hypothetical protein